MYADQKKDPALVRDLVVLTQGPDMGVSLTDFFVLVSSC